MDSSKIKIEVLKDLCIGISSCVQVAGDIFELGEDNKAKFKKGNFLSDYPNVTIDQLIEAAESCPTMAIKLTNTETGEVIYPK